MAIKPCPRCRKMIPAGAAYCDACREVAKAESEAAREKRAAKAAQKYNRRRDPKYSTFYRSAAWRAQSRAKLQSAGYRCEAKTEVCTGLAVEVHHIKPIQSPDGWEKRLEWENLEAVCAACHNARHPEKLHRRRDEDVIDLRDVRR